MKPDDFEQRLQRQPLRKIPAGWREEILAAADVNRRKPPVRELTFAATIRLRLRELLWPCPQAWAGLAGVWLVILAVNLAARDPLTVRQARKTAPASPNILLALKEQERLLAELTGSCPTMPPRTEKPVPLTPQPRSQRREDCSFV